MRAHRKTHDRARALRQSLSPPEILLWTRLRRRGHGAPVFRRQHPIGPYIADFYCPRARLVVEIDGWGHADPAQVAHDEHRDAHMAGLDYHVVRIPAAEVMRDADAVADGMVRTAIGMIDGEA